MNTMPWRLPLVWKILTPTIAIVALLGPAAGFVLARDRATRADVAISRELTSIVVNARARLHERALYVREAVNQAANLQGMASAIDRRDVPAVDALLDSVRAVKTDLALLAVVGHNGFDPGGAGALAAGADASAMASRLIDGRIVVSAPVCRPAPDCVPVGTAIAAIGVADALTATNGARATIVLTDSTIDADRLTRRNSDVQGRAMATMYAPFDLDGERLATVEASVPRDETTTGGAAVKLASMLTAGMALAVGLGLFLARSVLAQVRELHATSTALGSGDLSRRAPVITEDEIGDLARVLNQMADELEASHGLLEARVEERTAEVRSLLQARTEFFTSLSHELRTPLAIILGQARLQRDPEYKGRRSDAAAAWEMVEESAKQLLQEVNQVLELARVSTGRLQPQLVAVDVADVLAPMVRRFSTVALSCGVRFELEVPSLPAARADPDMLRDIINNVVDNAVKYTPTGGAVVLRAAARNGSVHIDVTDTGAGIPQNFRDRVFEPFFRVPGVTTQHGEPSTGIGLAVARQLAEVQHGNLTVSDNRPSGTTVTLVLPRADV